LFVMAALVAAIQSARIRAPEDFLFCWMAGHLSGLNIKPGYDELIETSA